MCQAHSLARRRGGLTLVEMLLAMSILGIMAGALTGLAMAVRQSTTYVQGYGAATQHARVTLERLNFAISQATATDQYPGAVVVYDQTSGGTFPDTLVVWRPSGPPVNLAGPPLVQECVFYCPNPSNPYQFLEVTAPSDSRRIPLNDAGLNTAAWRLAIKALATSSTSNVVLLTDLVRTGSADGVTQRAAIRFVSDLHPTVAEWAAYQQGDAPWSSLGWPQGIVGSMVGLRQVAIRAEIELLPLQAAGTNDPAGQLAIPFLGSSTFSYTLHQ
jgi:prepilin-type N-terminal cleavage/methylation domain-containing protein